MNCELPEYAEVHTTVGAVVYKSWMCREVILLSVFKDKDATVFQQRQCLVGNLRKGREGVWRVGKDKVKLSLARLQELEHVAPDEGMVQQCFGIGIS